MVIITGAGAIQIVVENAPNYCHILDKEFVMEHRTIQRSKQLK